MEFFRLTINPDAIANSLTTHDCMLINTLAQ